MSDGNRKTQAVRELRAAIVADIRANFENWPAYLYEFEDRMTSDEIRAEAEYLFRRMERRR